jgi:LysR family glycine cleavage system transcriptional activator
VLFSESSHVIQAAIEGNVVALCDFSMVANDLSSGRLVRPFNLGIKMAEEFAYHLVYPVEASNDLRIAAFRDWLMHEVRNPQMDPALQAWDAF